MANVLLSTGCSPAMTTTLTPQARSLDEVESFVPDGMRVVAVRCKDALEPLVAAAGCALTALIATFMLAAPGEPLLAATHALAVFGLRVGLLDMLHLMEQCPTRISSFRVPQFSVQLGELSGIRKLATPKPVAPRVPIRASGRSLAATPFPQASNAPLVSVDAAWLIAQGAQLTRLLQDVMKADASIAAWRPQDTPDPGVEGSRLWGNAGQRRRGTTGLERLALAR
ncbi:hypothetical protein TSOC_007862 [Tetrabaena socialis]|uniref:Uncharacterized protein n=1 Tax=Tetrabaena socialis TaxID=47790 RepID=A0A2J7ZZZ1_9CHLO|nr:hypothetical protein TSOC_007862 [Tetrabaena socialis]|eukprot:PNH05842.1 hypothetical protein TSOC_007862 [Tetrabaena socialis]